MTQYRQGDVFLRRVTTIPAGLKKAADKKVILAYGEVTGHHHRFEGGNVTAFYKEGDDNTMAGGTALRGGRTEVRFIDVAAVAKLLHEEHTAIPVEPGQYEVVIQREYDMMQGVRRVMD